MIAADGAIETPAKRDRSHQGVYDVRPHLQSCPTPGCSALIQWREVTETERGRKPARPLRKHKVRFRRCCVCSAKVHLENQILSRRRLCPTAKPTTKPR